MRVGLIVDAERLANERPMLDRLAAALAEAGDEVTRFHPDHDESHLEDDTDLVSTVAVPTSVPIWLQRSRARALAAAVEKAVPDVLYAIGHDAWPVAMHFAAEIERPIAVDIVSAEQVRSAPRGRMATNVAAYVVPTASLGQMLAARVTDELVSVVPMGVDVPAQPPAILDDPDRSISIAIIGPGRSTACYAAMLSALQRAVRARPQIQAAIELREPHGHAIWRDARRLDLLSHLSAITDASPLRALVTQCDLLLVPERCGEMRSLLLEAMAAGMAIVAASDPALDMLTDGETASITSSAPDADQWNRAIRDLLAEPQRARDLGRSAHRHIGDHHRPEHQVQALRSTFERILSGGAYPFVESE